MVLLSSGDDGLSDMVCEGMWFTATGAMSEEPRVKIYMRCGIIEAVDGGVFACIQYSV